MALFSFVLLLLTNAQAQEKQHDDFGIWGDVHFTKTWDNGIYIGLRAEGRSCDLTRSLDCWFIRPIVGYKPLKWLKFDAAYDFLMLPESCIRHDFLFSVTGTLKRENLSVSWRERYMLMAMHDGSSLSHTLRSFLQVKYQIGESRFAPYMAIELFTWDKWQKTRHYVGTDIRVSKHSALDIYYVYYTFAGRPAEHIAGIGYNISL